MQWTLDYPDLDYPDLRLSGFEVKQNSKFKGQTLHMRIARINFFVLFYSTAAIVMDGAVTVKAKAHAKRKRIVLSISDKLEIVDLLDKSVSYTVICEKYGVGRSTVGDIKKNREKIISFKKEMIDMGMKRKAKVMKLADNSQVDRALYMWFTQKRTEGIPVSGPMLCEKAMQFNSQLQGNPGFRQL